MANPKLNFDLKTITQHKNFSLVVMSALVVLIILDLVFILMPEIKLISGLNSKGKIEAQKLQLGKRELGEVTKISDDLQKKLELANFLESKFVTEDKLALIIETISKLASESAVNLVQVTPLKQIDLTKSVRKLGNEAFVEIPIVVSGTSDYHSLGKFINALEKAKEYMRVADFKILGNPLNYKQTSISLNIIAMLKAK